MPMFNIHIKARVKKPLPIKKGSDMGQKFTGKNQREVLNYCSITLKSNVWLLVTDSYTRKAWMNGVCHRIVGCFTNRKIYTQWSSLFKLEQERSNVSKISAQWESKRRGEGDKFAEEKCTSFTHDISERAKQKDYQPYHRIF